MLWFTNTPKQNAIAKAEHLVIAIRLTQNMLSQTLMKRDTNNKKSCTQKLHN